MLLGTVKANRPFRTAFCASAVLLACMGPAVAASAEDAAAATETVGNVSFRAESPWVDELGARVRLVVAKAAHDDRPFLAGVEMELDPGWHTYWRKPGDSGSTPVFGWSKSDNIDYVHVRWPAPQRFDKPGDVTYGYDNSVIWPVLVTPREAGKPVKLHLGLFFAACSNICVPHDVTLELDVPAASKKDKGYALAADTDYADDIRASLARVPLPPDNPDLVNVALKADGAKGTLDVTLNQTPQVPPMLAVEGPYYAWFGVPEVTREAKAIRYAVPMRVDKEKSLAGKTLTLTLSNAGGEGGYEIEYTVPGSEAAAKTEPKPENAK